MSFELALESFPSLGGPLRYAPVPWDSQTFEFPVVEVRCDPNQPDRVVQHLPALLAKLDGTPGRALTFIKIPVGAIAIGRALSRNGFYPVETMVELHLALAKFKPVVDRPLAGLTLRTATESDLPRLIELAGSAFHADRFHIDENIPGDAANRRFANWIERGVRDNDLVFCFDDTDGRVLGFYHVRAKGQTVDLSLAAVDRTSQKRGIGLLMYQAVLAECRNRGYALAETRVTVHNIDVLNLFVRLGFALRNPTLTFHRYKA